MKIAFYMKSGSVIEVDGVAKIEMTRNNQTGEYSGYTLKWEDKEKYPFFSLNIAQIEAVVEIKQ